MKQMRLLVMLIAVATQAQTMPTAQTMQSIKDLVLTGILKRSPQGHFIAKDFAPGVKSFRNDARCIQDDVVNLFKTQDPPQTVSFFGEGDVIVDARPNERTKDLSLVIKDFEQQLISEMKTQLMVFNSRLDPITLNREVCMGSLRFESPNAVSSGLGFLLFDPQLFFNIVRHERTNEWSLRAVIAHEFAHQLQFWTLDPTVFKTKNGKPFVRDQELQADCVASAILTELHERSQQPDRATFGEALGGAFASLGDFELHHAQHHHGTAYERTLMIEAGQKQWTDLTKATNFKSQSLLDGCRDYINHMNQKYGEELWPFASRP
jgi:hypothetical protein